MLAPGTLSDLGSAGAAAWQERVEQIFADVAAALERDMGETNAFVLPAPDERTPSVTGPDWTALPVRVTTCVGLDHGLKILDLPSDGTVDGGGRGLQEDYVEWRVRHRNRRLERVELTTELSDYWRVLAAHEPARLLDLVGAFADEDSVEQRLIFGSCDPFACDTTPDDRERAFASSMLGPRGRSPYNNGERAICCAVQRTNTLGALFSLALAATNCRVIRDAVGGELRCLTCVEAIPLVGRARLGRGSDPVLVERLGRLAYEGRFVAFDDPVGVYIQGAEHTRLRTPHGEVVPADWFEFDRGIVGPDGRSRYQRLTFAVPPDEGYTVGELVDIATGRRIKHGGEIADLVRVVVFFRVSAPDAVPVDRETPVELAPPGDDPLRCDELRTYASNPNGEHP